VSAAVVQSGAIAYVNGTGTSTTVAPVLSSAASASDRTYLYAYLDSGGYTSGSITTPSGWTLIGSFTDVTGPYTIAAFYQDGFTGTTVTVTMGATPSLSGFFVCAALQEWSGVTGWVHSYLGSARALTAIPQTLSGSALTPSVANSVMISFWGWNDTPDDVFGGSVQSGFTSDIQGAGSNSTYADIYVGHQINPAAGTPITETLNFIASSYNYPSPDNLAFLITPPSAGLPPFQPIYQRAPILAQ
jgi:hypothetical protein